MPRSIKQRFEALRSIDDRFFALLDGATESIRPALSVSKRPKTASALFAIGVKAAWLKNGVFEMHETDNLYAGRALFRALTEHYLKGVYLFARNAVDKTDDVGTEYFNFCGAAEMIEYGEAWRARGRLFGQDRLIEYATMLDRFYPSLSSYSPKIIAARSAQFKYRAILRYLANNASELVSVKTPFLANVIPSYALLSSYVHGGPTGAVEFAVLPNATARRKEAFKDAELAFLLASHVQSLAVLVLGQDSKALLPLFSEMARTLKQYARRSKSTPNQPMEADLRKRASPARSAAHGRR